MLSGGRLRFACKNRSLPFISDRGSASSGEEKWCSPEKLLKEGDIVIPGTRVESPLYHGEMLWPIDRVILLYVSADLVGDGAVPLLTDCVALGPVERGVSDVDTAQRRKLFPDLTQKFYHVV